MHRIAFVMRRGCVSIGPKSGKDGLRLLGGRWCSAVRECLYHERTPESAGPEGIRGD